MSPRYCLPIISSKKTEIINLIEENLEKFEFFEVWLDYVDDLSLSFVKDLMVKLDKKLIILFRRQNLEKIKASLSLREEILKIINGSKVWLDLDIGTQGEELATLKKNNLKINKILSFHSYSQTPTKKNLKKIIETMNQNGADIYKIATYCKSEQDALNLLEILLQLREENKKYIVLGMGEKGVITRIFGALWGNEMTFTPISKERASAPGQLTRSQLEMIFKQLN